MASQLSLALELLGDPSPATRVFAVRMLVDSPEAGADSILAKLVIDREDRVAEEAIKVLRHRCPWLAVEPTPVAEPTAAAAASRQGLAWQACRRGIDEAIGDCGGEVSRLRRYGALPGLIPDVVERLDAAGYSAQASDIAYLCDLHGNGAQTEREGRQLLVSPTYRCNIDCSYCYAKSWDERYSAELPVEKIPVLLDWAAAQNVKLLQLAGGEPTVYRHFATLLAEAKRRGMRIIVTSNGLFPKASREAITRDSVDVLVAHYDQEHVGSPSELRERFIANIAGVRERGVNVILRYTLTPESDEQEREQLLDTAVALGVGQVNFGFAFKNFAGNNTHSAFSPGQANPHVERQFMGFVAACAARGIKVHQSKPMPLCMFSQDAIRPLLLDGSLGLSCTAHRGGCTQNLTVNPDLSTFPCNAIGVEGPKVCADLTLAQIGERNKPFFQTLHRHPYAESCKHCFYFYRGFCQGACLVEHYGQLKNAPAFTRTEADTA